jgi:hypothetical protein
MRKFGTDSPELMRFQLGDSDKVYTMPLAASLPSKFLVEMEEIEDNNVEAFKFQLKVLKTYIGDVADELTAKDIGEIFTAWYEESEKQGADVGES